MKKLVSMLLAVCMCFSIAFVFTSCLGGKNAWQEYLGAKGWSVSKTEALVEKTEGRVGALSDGYSLTGGLDVKGRGNGESIYAVMKHRESHLKATDGVTDYDDYRYIDYSVSYNAKSNKIYVDVVLYSYFTTSVGEKNGEPDWKDGFAYLNSGTGSFLTLTLDMSSYFKNGKLTAADITENSGFNTDFSRNYTGLVGDTAYTERNAQWETQTMDAIMGSINETLALIDGYIKANPA